MATQTQDSAGAAVFVLILNQAAGDTQYNLLGLNGDWAGQTLSAAVWVGQYPASNSAGFVILEPAPMSAQGSSGGQDQNGNTYETAIWLFDSQTNALTCSYIQNDAQQTPVSLTFVLAVQDSSGGMAFCGTGNSQETDASWGIDFGPILLELVPAS